MRVPLEAAKKIHGKKFTVPLEAAKKERVPLAAAKNEGTP